MSQAPELLASGESGEMSGDEATAPPSPSDGDVLRVLVVDDDAGMLDAFRDIFVQQGCLVATAGTAEQALGILADRPMGLVVSDVKMPGLSGLDLLQAVQRTQPETPVVLVTGIPSVESAIGGLRRGAYDYLMKPVSVKALADLVERIRRDAQPGRRPQPACVADDMVRHHVGMEGLFRVTEQAIRGLEPDVFMELVLNAAIRGLQADAAVILQRGEDGTFSHCEQGSPTAIHELLTVLRESIGDLLDPDRRTVVPLTRPDDPLVAQAVRIPRTVSTTTVLAVARDAERGGFLPDEQALLLGYARTTALALEKALVAEHDEARMLDAVAFFVRMIESKDSQLQGHSARVSLYAAELAIVLGLSLPEVGLCRRAGLLHELGKLVILDSLLQKPGRLTESEDTLVRQHPVIAEKILRSFPRLEEEASVVRHHLERYDGTGSPDGQRGDQISLAARILAIADAFDAMTSPRPYREAMTVEAACRELVANAGTQFDPALTDAFGRLPMARLSEISGFYRSDPDR